MKANKNKVIEVKKKVSVFTGSLILIFLLFESVLGQLLPPYDFDDDRATDLSFFNNGIWRIRFSTTGDMKEFSFGTTGDVPVPEWYFGLTPPYGSRLTVWRPSNAHWYISTGSGYQETAFGISSDKPVPFDYDDDVKADIAIFRNGTWYILKSSNNTVEIKYFGQSEDIPVPGYYSGTPQYHAVFRPSNFTWYLPYFEQFFSYQWGTTGDILVPAAYDADAGLTMCPAVYRPSEGKWYILKASTVYTTSKTVYFGLETDIPVPGDYNSDNLADFAFYRPSNFSWYILNMDEKNFEQIEFGGTNYGTPLPGSRYR